MISEFSILDYCFPLDVLSFKKYLDENSYKYKFKNNVIAFTLEKKINGFVICDDVFIKYIRINFVTFDWNQKNDIVNELNSKYTLVSHSASTNTRLYGEYNILYTYGEASFLEATFRRLSLKEEQIKERRINRKDDVCTALEVVFNFLDIFR